MAKLRAVETHRTLTAVIEDALRPAIEGKGKPPLKLSRRVRIPTTGAGGVLAGVDLDDMSSVMDRMEGRS